MASDGLAQREPEDKPQTGGSEDPSERISATHSKAQKEAAERDGPANDSSADCARRADALDDPRKVDLEPERHGRENSAATWTAVQPELREGKNPSDPKPDSAGRVEPGAQSSAEEPGRAPEQKQVALPQEQQRAEGEGLRPIASFESNAVKQATDGMTRFEVRKESFEWKTGVSIARDKVYAVEWEIEGLGVSRKILDGSSESSRMAFFAPKEASESIAAGEKRTVRVYSVKEISANRESMGEFYVTPYRVGKEGVRFDILVATFEKRTRANMKEGLTYEVHYKIGERELRGTHTASRENEHVVVTMYGERAKDLEPGKEQTVVVSSVEEKRTLPVTGDGPNTRVTLQKRMLESFGVDVDSMKKGDEDDRIIEVTLRNLASEEKSEKTVYAKLQPSEGTLPLSIHNIGAKRGDRVEVTSASKHTVKDFVNDFENRKGEEIRNVRLSLDGEKLYIEVDGIRFQCKSYEQDALRLRRYLKVNVEPFQRDFRFWDDGERITAKFGDSWTIKSFTANDNGLSIHYQMGSRTINSNFLSPSDKTVLDGDYLRPEEISLKTKMLSRPEIVEGFLSFENGIELHSYVYGRLTQALHISLSKYNEERGNLGEDMGIAMLKNSTMEEVKRHPFSKDSDGRGSHKPGTDVLMRDLDGRLVLFEFKWRIDPDIAMKEGLKEVRRRQHAEKEYKGERISGAYVAVLDYSMKSRRGILRVERAW